MMVRPRSLAATLLATVVVALPLPAAARDAGKTSAAIPPGGGLEGVEVALDGAAGALRVRRGSGPPRAIPIPIEKSRLDLGHASIEVHGIGEGRQILHVRVPDVQRKDLAFEAIVSGHADEPVFAGLTGYTRGEEGDRSGQVVLVYDRDRDGPSETKFILVAEAREDTRICGQATTPLGARGLDPKTMQLRGATLHRLEKAARDGATRVVAQAIASSKPPLARLLRATGGSAPASDALTDGNPETVWSEKRPGDGHGEFATLQAPAEVPIHSLVVTVAPPGLARSDSDRRASPRTFFLATDQRLFQVTMPEDAWQKPGASYVIPLPEPIRTTCVALVLDEAYTRGQAAPDVSVAEIAAHTRFDAEGASLDEVARELGGAGARSDEAAGVLKRGGDAGLTATIARFPTLDPRGRALAVDVAASAGGCEGPGAELVTLALSDRESEVKRRALGRIERCGKAAATSLAAAVRSSDEPRRAASAPLLAAIAPQAAIDPIAENLGAGSPETRRALRGAFARAAASASRDKLLEVLARKQSSPQGRLELLRAAGPRLPELRPESSQAIAEILRASPDMATRWLVVQPLAQLARSADASEGELTRLAELARRDPEWPVRARAVELAAGIGPLLPTVLAATADPEPRVREAALRAIATGKANAGTDASARALAGDPWTFVRVAAAEALGATAESRGSQEVLARSLGDRSPRVRAAAMTALGAQRATRYADAIRRRLDDTKEDIDVRTLAARTLGAMCVQGAVDRLTKLASLARSPTDDNDDRLGIAAIEALAELHPADLERRLAPLRDKSVRLPVRRAVDRALAEPGNCR